MHFERLLVNQRRVLFNGDGIGNQPRSKGLELCLDLVHVPAAEGLKEGGQGIGDFLGFPDLVGLRLHDDGSRFHRVRDFFQRRGGGRIRGRRRLRRRGGIGAIQEDRHPGQERHDSHQEGNSEGTIHTWNVPHPGNRIDSPAVYR